MICVEKITVSPTSITLLEGSYYYNVCAIVSPTNASCSNVKWYSSDTSIATVNQTTGYIYAQKSGTTRIYAEATDGSGVRDYITVDVKKFLYVESVNIEPSTISINEGECYELSATVCPLKATNKTLTWTSSNTNVATVCNGKVYAVSNGYTMIKATATDGSGVSGYCGVIVTGDILVTSVSVNPPTKVLQVGKSYKLCETVQPCDATNPCVEWISSNSDIVSVNPTTGYIYANKQGTAVIYAQATDGSGKRGSCVVTVTCTIFVNNIMLNKSSLILDKGCEYELCAKPEPDNASNKSIRWSSSNTNVATVDSYTGVVYAKTAGRATIYATAQDGSGVNNHCYVTVRQNSSNPEEDKGEVKVTESTCADPVDICSGAHILKNTIMTLWGGQGLQLTAHYDSSRLAEGEFGAGWYHNYEKRLEIIDCEARVYSSPSVYSKYIADNECNIFNCTTVNKNGYVLAIDCSQEYPYVINCNFERTEYYNAQGKLAKIVDHTGFETLITYSETLTTIIDTVSGKKIYLEKDTCGKVIRVYDDASRQATLTYNRNLLTSICDVNGNSLTYTYNADGQVISSTDSKGICYFTNTYDESGRVIAQKDGASGSLNSLFTYEDDGKRTTTNRNGQQSIRVFDANGLLVSYTDENGNTKTYTYDSRYNIIKETDANGKSIVKQYNSFNKPVSITDRNDNKTTISYDAKGNIVKISHPEINGVIPEEFFVYNSRNQLTQHTDLRGTVTEYTYDTLAMPLTKKVGSRNAIQYSYQDGMLVSQTDAMGNTIRYGYNTLGQMTSVTDANNNITLYEYDAIGNLIKTTDANGKTIINTYDGNNQKTSVVDANGNRTEYSYNGNMKNDIVILPDGNSIRYEFDGEDRPVKVTDQAGNVTTTQYDKVGRVISKRFADSGTVNYEYDKVGNVVKETNPKGAATIKTYDANGNVLSVKDNNGNITRYQYNAMGKKVRAVNAASGAVIYEYSKAGDLLSETDALGNKKTYTYDSFGNMLTAIDAKGNITTYTYDANNNMLSVRDALGNTTTYTYNSLNQLVSVKDAKNNTVTYGYDALGRRTTITDAKNNVFTTMYDGNGNVIKTLDAKGNTVSETVYNCLNLPASVIDAQGKTTTYTYTALGKVATATDSMNHRQEYSYNSRGLNTSVRDANNGTSRAEYDTLGNITKLTGPMGSTVNYTYDQMGRLIAETTSSGGTISYGYNELNVKEQLTNARSQKRKYFHDAMGRITGFVGEEDSVSYTYDANGNVLTITDSNGTVKREYDALNRVIKYTDTYGKSICYEYDSVGNLTRLVYPDNTSVTYTYDANNNLVSVTDWANRVTSYTYDANNRVTGVVKPDGSITTTVYDSKQRVTSTVEKTASGTVITGFEYTYDSLSNIVEENHLADNTKICYTYDSLNRVTKRTIKNECEQIISVENYSYDAAGNITDAPNSCFIYDANNRLTKFNGNSVTYDMDGNMLSDGCSQYKYDSANRLIKAGGHTYTYNAEDVRIRNLCSDADTTYTYNTNCKLSQLLQKTTNGITTKYVYGLGLIGEEKCGEFKTYHFDYRGSTVAITDINSNITDTFKYDTYGKMTEHIGNSFVIFGYNGRDGVVTDKNGLIYMRARYYSPDMRRFINADVLHGEISDSTSLNRYSYVNGNPVSFVDPFGLSKERGYNFFNIATNKFAYAGFNVNNNFFYHYYFNKKNKQYGSVANYDNCIEEEYNNGKSDVWAKGKLIIRDNISIGDIDQAHFNVANSTETLVELINLFGEKAVYDLIAENILEMYSEKHNQVFFADKGEVSYEVQEHIEGYFWATSTTTTYTNLITGKTVEKEYSNPFVFDMYYILEKNSDAAGYTKEDYMIRKCETVDILKEGSKAESIWYYNVAPIIVPLKQPIKEFVFL